MPQFKADLVMSLLDRLAPIQEEIEKTIDFKNAYQIMLYEPKLLLEHRKECRAFLGGVRLYNLIKTTGFNRDWSRHYIKQIKQDDQELAIQISRILPLADDKPLAFTDLINAYARGREYFVSYIVTHADNLVARARSIPNQQIARKLVRLFFAISGQELQYLGQYKQDCDNWPNPRYAINYGIGFFIRRLNLYIKGGFEENTKFMGVYKDFHDEELTQNLTASNAVRNLWKHNEQMNYLIVLIGACIEAQKSGEWKGFYGKGELSINGAAIRPFWPNFKEHAEAFASKYGNAEFTAELKSKKDKIGENPKGWGGVWEISKTRDLNSLRLKGVPYVMIEGNLMVMAEDGVLPKLLRMLQDPAYQRRRIILPCSEELNKIFGLREKSLAASRDKSINDLIEMLMELSGLSIDRKKVVTSLKRILRKRKSKIIRNISFDADELFSRARQPLLECLEYSNALDSIIQLIDPDYIRRKLERLYRLSRWSLWNAGKELSRADSLERITGDWRDFLQVDVSLNAAKTAKVERRRLISDEHLSLEDLKLLQRLVNVAPAILQSLKILERYIKSKMESAYTMGTESLNNLDAQPKNEKMKMQFVKAAFDGLI